MILKVEDTLLNSIIEEIEIEDVYLDDEHLFNRYFNVFVKKNQKYYGKSYALRLYEDGKCAHQFYYDHVWEKMNQTKVSQKDKEFWDGLLSFS